MTRTIRHIPASESSYRDRSGRQLAYRVEPAGQNIRHVIQFIEPVRAYDGFTLISATDVKASRDGAKWTFSTDQNWGCKKNHYADVVILPAGAQVVSVDPISVTQTSVENRPHIEFAATLGFNERWEYTVDYRLTE